MGCPRRTMPPALIAAATRALDYERAAQDDGGVEAKERRRKVLRVTRETIEAWQERAVSADEAAARIEACLKAR